MGVQGRVFLFGAASLAALSCATAVNAQSADSQSSTIEEIVVTAQRRTENLQDVPLAITALSADQLAKSGVHGLEDVGDRTPGVYFKSLNVGMPNVAVRGIGTTQNDNSSEAPVGLFVDDVYIARHAAGLSSLYDIDRIEILRGPQGTLYGRNTIGGAINVITRDPTQDRNGEIEVEAGSYGAFRTRGAVGGGLTDTISGRIAFATNDRKGWTRNLETGKRYNEENNVAGRAKLLFEPSENARFKLSADYVRDNNNDFLSEFKGTFALSVIVPRFSELTPNQPYVTRQDVDGRQKRTVWRTSLNSDIDLTDSIALTSITAYQHHDYDGLRDLEAGPNPILRGKEDERGHQFSQEIRLTSTGDTAFKWLAGVYYFKESSNRSDRWTLGGLFPAFAAFAGDYVWVFDTTAESAAVFGQASYAFTDQLELVAGLRYSRDEKSGDYAVSSTAVSALGALINPTAGFTNSVSKSWSSVDPAITLNFKPTDSILLYASYKTGFKSGGFQYRPQTRVASSIPYDPEDLKAWEAGFKSEWLDRRLIANVSAFSYDYTDLQQLVLIPGTASTVTDNVGSARVRGAEFEVTARPIPGLDINLGYAYLDAKIRDYVDSSGVQRAGNRLSRAPKHSVNLATQYTADLADNGSLSFRLEYLWHTETFFLSDNSPVNRDGPVDLLNARIAYTTADDRLTVAVLGSNLTKEVYCANQATSIPSGTASRCFVGAPRQFSVNLKYKFD